MKNTVRGGFIDRFAGTDKEGLRFFYLTGFDSFDDFARRGSDGGSDSEVLGAACSVGLHAANGRYDIWQVVHLLSDLFT